MTLKPHPITLKCVPVGAATASLTWAAPTELSSIFNDTMTGTTELASGTPGSYSEYSPTVVAGSFTESSAAPSAGSSEYTGYGQGTQLPYAPPQQQPYMPPPQYGSSPQQYSSPPPEPFNYAAPYPPPADAINRVPTPY